MCIIAIKNKGVSLPSEQTLEAMFKNNSDGAGFMYATDNKVIINKGFMTFRSFKSALDKLKEEHDITSLPLIMHFRIATSGQVDGGTTHPFPLSAKRKQLRKQHIETDIGIVHNGIIPIKTPNNMSDTMQYIAKQLTVYKRIQADFYTSEHWRRKIEKEIKSKMVFMDNNGEIYMIGDFITDKGMIYSNHSYEEHSFVFGYEKFLDYTPQSKLCPIDGYITTHCGELVDCEDGLYLISKYGQVYEYDFNFDVAVPITATAYTYESVPFFYDESHAFYFNVSDYHSIMIE